MDAVEINISVGYLESPNNTLWGPKTTQVGTAHIFSTEKASALLARVALGTAVLKPSTTVRMGLSVLRSDPTAPKKRPHTSSETCILISLPATIYSCRFFFYSVQDASSRDQ